VSNIHEESVEEDIHDLFSEYGEILLLNLILDKQTGLSKGFAFIEYKDLENAKEAINNLNEKEYRERTLKVSFAFKKNPIPLNKIFI
jgi:RNA recognition motif-containing protein